MVNSVEILELLNALVEKNQAFDVAIRAAEKEFEHKDRPNPNGALDLLTALVKRGKAFSTAIKFAEKGARNKDVYTQGKSIDLLKFLVELDQGFDSAIKVAKNNLENPNIFDDDPRWYTIGKSISLLKALFMKNQGVAAATRISKERFERKDVSSKLLSFRILHELVIAEKSIDAAIKAAKKGSQDKNPSVRQEAENLRKLVQKNSSQE